MFLLLGCTACSDEKTIEQEQTKQEQQKETDVPKETDKPKKTDTPKETAVETPVMQEEAKEPDSSKKEEKVELNNTYKTRLSEVDGVDCPIFDFDYPDNWKITNEEMHQDNCAEKVVLENDRGVTITYTDYGRKLEDYGSFLQVLKVSKVTDSSFIPGYVGTDGERSDLGECMVAKIKTIGEMWKGVDMEPEEVDGAVYYAVVPESYLGIQYASGMDGFNMVCSFEYGSFYSFCAEAPDGKFTEEEEKEVVEILASFREANYGE